MSVPLAGYSTLRLLRTSPGTRVYEAERNRDSKRVLAKVFAIDDPTIEARVQHELHLLRQLELDGVVSPIGLERAGRELVLLLEWVHGQNLEQAASGRAVPVDTFLPRALAMAEILAQIHARQIIHRDIKPSNILLEAETGRIVFADFGISVLLERERRRVYDPDVLEGTLPYVSPEQTGRTQRDVDFRSDLYSLGVTFYELLTGRRPFEASAPIELIHAHLAREPEPPQHLVPSLPERLSAIVMKLLEKAPEHRYQSAQGLHADLARLADALAEGIPEPSFRLAEHDRARVLQLPHRLYGREAESTALARELSSAVIERSRHTLVILGELGVGKSALLAELASPLAEYRGYLAIGKFEDRGRDVPYSALLRACQGLLEQILTESDAALARWTTHLREALGSIAGVFAKLIPELALIIGETQPVPALPPAESQNRLHLGFNRLLTGMARVGPLVLCLDDLQWADDASIELLSALTRDGPGPMLIVLACRDDISSAHLERLSEHASRTLRLAPLTRDDLDAMLADALGGDAERNRSLADFVERKTGRRPLLARRLLHHLAREGLLTPEAGGWTWRADALAEASVSDDVVEVLDAALDRIAPAELSLLEIAACVGESFDPRIMPKGLEDDDPEPAELFTGLHALERAGLVDAVGDRYRFAHPRMHASVYTNIDPLRRRRLHAAIGRRLLGRARDRAEESETEVELAGPELFAIVDQLDSGFYPLDDEEPELALDATQRRDLAELNLAAGNQALEASAWGTARRYYQCAVSLFGRGELRDRARFQARFGHAQTLHLDGELALADAAFEALMAEQLSLADQALVTDRRIKVLAHTGETKRAVAVGVEALRRCDFDVEPGGDMDQLRARFIEVARSITLEDLLELPRARDERVLAITSILYTTNDLTFSVDRRLYLYFVTAHLELARAHGFHASLISELHNVGFALLAMHEFEQARRISEIALELGVRRNAGVRERLVAERSWLVHIGPCFAPFHEFARNIPDAHRRAVEAGERIDASTKGAIGLVIQLEACLHLSDVWTNFERFHADHEDWGTEDLKAMVGGVLWFHGQMTGSMAGLTAGMPKLPSFDDPEVSSIVRYGVIITKIWAAVLFDDHAAAWDMAESIAEDYEAALFGSWTAPRFAVLDAVVVGARAQALDHAAPDPEARAALVNRLEQRIATLERWAAHSPDNFDACLDIARGERAALDGDNGRAIEAYERAREGAAAHGRAYVEGLAHLRMAALADRLGWSALSDGATRGAYRAFERWGAWAVVEGLEERLGASVGAVADAPRGPETRTVLPTSSANLVPSLDLGMIIALVQSISEDLRLEEVIVRAVESAVESAGADRGALLLERDDALGVVAEGRAGEPATYFEDPRSLSQAHDQLPTTVIRYVVRTSAPVVVDDVLVDPRFANDPYIQRSGVRSLLCMPIVKQSELIGVLVLENRLQPGAFSEARLMTCRILLSQAASSLDNARLYSELYRNEAQWRSLVDGAPDIITLLDERGHIEFVNHVDPHDIDPSSLVGEPGDQLLEPSSGMVWRAAFAEVIATGELREIELCVAPTGAPRRWYMTRLAAVHDEGQLRRVISIATDITDRKAYEALQRQQQRLESIGTLAAGVAHEINNPIQGILNYAELIAGRADDPATVREFSAEITHESERVATIVRNLLVFSRQEREHGDELIAVRKLVGAALSLIRSVLRKDDIALDVDIADGLPPLRCRPQQLQQIIMNLVTNARDALNDSFPEFDERKRIRIFAEAFERDGPWIRIAVEDQAAGIPDDVLIKIFDPFYTTKGRDQGTGLGLSVSHGIALEHGGDLRVETVVGVGSKFMLELPAAADA